MNAGDVTKDNIHIAVALLLEGQKAQMRSIEQLADTLDEVRQQVTRTNGRVNHHDSQIERLSSSVCPTPGACVGLAERVRKLEDQRLRNEGRVEGAVFAGRAVHWLAGGSVVAIITAVAKALGVL